MLHVSTLGPTVRTHGTPMQQDTCHMTSAMFGYRPNPYATPEQGRKKVVGAGGGGQERGPGGRVPSTQGGGRPILWWSSVSSKDIKKKKIVRRLSLS
jgi:hypothetical protein